MYKIALFRGDGIGPEVAEQAVKVIRKVGEISHVVFDLSEALLGGASIDEYERPVTPEALALARNSDAVLIGAVGGPQWDNLETSMRPESGLLELRRSLETYANLRPVHVFPSLENHSTLKEEVIRGLDFLIVRELTGGIYFGTPRGIQKLTEGVERGVNTEVYTTPQIERIAHRAFSFARKRRRKVTSVDKANILESSQLWRKVVTRVHRQYQDVTLDYRYVDDCAMQLVRNPKQFDVIVTTNLFGDILSDESAMLTGSIGMLPSASLGDRHAIYEPVHGSAPDITGKDMANPIAAILSVAMMMEYSFHLLDVAKSIEDAVSRTLAEGYRTADIDGGGAKRVSCSVMGDLIQSRIGL